MQSAERAKGSSLRFGVAAVLVSAGLVIAPGHGVAWADDTGSTSTSSESGPASKPNPSDEPKEQAEAEQPEPKDTDPADDTSGLSVKEPKTTPRRAGIETRLDRDEPLATRRVERSVRTSRTVTNGAPSAVLTIEAPTPPPVQPTVAARTAAPNVVGAVAPSAVVVTTPTPPKPLSPIATVLELPGRIINAVLQFLDFTAGASGPRSPFNIAPINDLLFGAFRELERLGGLHRTPTIQPVLPTMTYTGPTDRPTPTVAQFLNASTAAYGWGTAPGGLVPLTANGFQLTSTNIFSGMSGKAWVTPQGQVIIAYQGTTGGTNLLVNPLITLAQLAADMQVILTGTTPLAFYDALRFARRVQDEAALQGYAADDVFVTGHSLGGWEAQFVAQQTGLAGIGFESPGLNTTVAGNGADSNFVNVAQYGSPVAFMATDLPGLQPFFPAYVPGGGTKPHYGPVVLIGDVEAMNPMRNAAAMWGKSLIGSLVFAVDFLGNFFQYHLMGVQAYHLDVDPDPGVVPWLGTRRGTVHIGYGELTIQQLLKAASDDGILITP
ncbi:hypothetical protein [Mycolicibacterium sp. P9-22]|uniref:hypothetical protein n=1 Tax=Mycolicibacterium sp. P9-22 TaxID=2024613 RepID=UPI0011ED5DDD|nr:hypothetical protein [Mycolicibacterium sp. P9-22]KAA0114461.1 hypothetical protein CIW51_19320 [Mycolicibacterium sp. P9-22]